MCLNLRSTVTVTVYVCELLLDLPAHAHLPNDVGVGRLEQLLHLPTQVPAHTVRADTGGEGGGGGEEGGQGINVPAFYIHIRVHVARQQKSI